MLFFPGFSFQSCKIHKRALPQGCWGTEWDDPCCFMHPHEAATDVEQGCSKGLWEGPWNAWGEQQGSAGWVAELGWRSTLPASQVVRGWGNICKEKNKEWLNEWSHQEAGCEFPCLVSNELLMFTIGFDCSCLRQVTLRSTLSELMLLPGSCSSVFPSE